ncbi:MAG: hypothetical protein A2X25_00010 [Chloroflexi bacterium GWB2_49_20]|nr:MAG: hypothetical protein A2X25_00010 [Chloroflexi bacterium GWB2_49_20]OGN76946.1 MAG: hypothetical protein A2X26_13555 [Chloroflexi bacterium GWC2_49_37]OGN84858.1 MAG: hypothetical protein A2X27_14900 [Chloroflexi bacterium GWD2_49_16]HCM96481.1 hypothetical protein [Anaerolineae bacterium]
MIHCHKCKTQNRADAQKCSQCGKDLLPGSGFGERASGFGCMIVLAALSIPIMYFCSQSAIAVGEGTGFSTALLILGPIFALMFLLFGLILAFRKVPMYERYQKRAERHILLDPQQALVDFTQAIANLPNKTSAIRLKLLKQRAELYTQQEMHNDAQTDYRQALTLADELYNTQPQKEKLQYLEERVNLLEKLGRQDEADLEGLNYTYLAEKALPEKKIAMGVREGIEQANTDSKRNDIHTKRKAILDRGRFKALGYCRKCKTAVELDHTLRCKVNAMHDKVKSIRFVRVEEMDRVKQEISASR